MLLTIVVYAAFIGLLVVATVIDLRTLRIPDPVIVALFVVWLAWRLAVHFGGVTTAPITFSQGIVGSSPKYQESNEVTAMRSRSFISFTFTPLI